MTARERRTEVEKPRTILDQAGEAAEIAREAFAAGDNATGIAAIKLAAQLVQLARIQEPDRLPPRVTNP